MATVKMTHSNQRGETAHASVPTKDVKAWEAAGWRRVAVEKPQDSPKK